MAGSLVFSVMYATVAVILESRITEVGPPEVI